MGVMEQKRVHLSSCLRVFGQHHPMRILLFSWLFLHPFFLILSAGVHVGSVSGQCLDSERSLLLQLKDDLKFDSATSTKLVNWNKNEDCCSWKGIGCDASGRVITLELDRESISSGVENSTSLFSLQYLVNMNLALNWFSYMPIPSGISNLTNLVHLNLSNAGFAGQIPIELSNLRNLVVLDLSTIFPEIQLLKLENPNLKALVKNLSNLEELYLDNVDISVQRSDWCQALASSLPRLTVLSLRNCHISGPIYASLTKLRSLSVIRLDGNNLSSTVPDFFSDFPNLRTLSISYCNLLGTFPSKIFQAPTLQVLDLSENELLQGSLQQFPHNGSLREIVPSSTNFSGSLPGSISNLRVLSRIDISNCSFSGPIPLAIANLTELVYLDFSSNNFSGPIPPFQNSKNLTWLDLSHNSLTGLLSPDQFKGLSNLENLHLGFNLFSGGIPSSLFALPSLKKLHLANNQLSGQIDEFPNASVSLLNAIDLSANRFNGSIPKSFFELRMLNVLSLSFNFFSGNFQLESIKNLRNLSSLELSYNNISVDLHSSNFTSSTWPQLNVLKLASCKLKMFPTELANQLGIVHLDLSDNQIEGEIPNWIWKVGGGGLIYLNLSSNLLVSLQKPYEFPHILVLDLHSNQLQGEIPIPPASAVYVDYSSNNFNNSISPNFGNIIHFSFFFSLSNNRLTGSIPQSMCNASYLQLLDFSNNSLTGKIPSCLVENNGTLGVLNLARNNLTGSIPNTFPVSCHLKTLDLSSNALEGKIPGSLSNCTSLEVLNLGNNKFEDTFPCRLDSSSLRVLVLRSNKLHGDVSCHGANNSWPELQIIDMACNNFSGVLTPEYFSGWRRMMLDNDDTRLPNDHLRYDFLKLNGFYYQDKVTVTAKGLEMQLVKIQTIFTSVDFSNNAFLGEIPKSIGDLKFLYILNLSHNAFTGKIPPSIGNLRDLGSLDLSVNQLTGEIPATLASLTFLSFLNLSVNNLSGMIPAGPQLQTFPATSYQENPGLCGFPVDAICDGTSVNNSSPSFGNMPLLQPKTEIKWEYIIASAGFISGLTGFTLLLLLCRGWREKYFLYVDQLLSAVINQKRGSSIAEHKFRK